MRSLSILLKNDFRCLFGALQGKKNRKKTGAVLTFVIVAYLGICALVGLQNYSLFEVMKDIGEVPLFNCMQIAFLITIVLTFQTMSGKSKTKDSDLLLSLPIKRTDIVVSKTLSKYLFAFAFLGMIMIPTIVLYSIFIKFAIAVILWIMLLWLLLPLLSVGLTFIVDFLTVKLFNRAKHSGLWKTLFILILFGTFMVFYIRNSIKLGTITMTSIDDFLNSNFIIGCLVKVIARNDLLSLLWIVLIVLGMFVIGTYLYANVYGKSFESFKSKKTNIDYIVKSNSSALATKEIKKYFTTPSYLVNTILGPVMLIILAIFLMVMGDEIVVALNIVDNESLFSILTLMSLFMCSMTQISCVSISLEGKYLWLYRSSPIAVKNIFLSKVVTNMIMFIPAHLFCGIALSIYFNANIVIALLYILLPILLNVIISFGGLYINLLFPKLDWDNETQVIKSSLSVLIGMLSGMIITVIPVILNLCKLNIVVTGFISLALYIIISITIISILFTDGIKKFNKLPC